MMREPCHRPDDFDDNGLLKAPVLFWGGLVMLATALAAAVCDGLALARQAPEEQDAVWLLLCADVACLSMLLPDRRLRAVFFSNGPCIYVNK